MVHRAGALVLLAPVVAACASASPGPWQTERGRDHPLGGRIWDVAGSEFIPPSTLEDRLAAGTYVLLGEKHDNPDHHRLQARLVRALIAGGRRPAVAFEMFTLDQAPAIARYLAARPPDAAGLGDAVGWRRSGWPDWAMYQPIADAAIAAGLPIVAANLSRATVQAAHRQGPGALDPGLVARHALDRPFPPAAQAAMVKEIREAHCGQAPDEMVSRMVLVQRARDAHMADTLSATGDAGAVLIAGAGHVRADLGVPRYLADGPPARVVTVAFLEVSDGAREPAAYAERFGEGPLPFDYVWFTPRVDDLDPCENFKESLERLRRPAPR